MMLTEEESTDPPQDLTLPFDNFVGIRAGCIPVYAFICKPSHNTSHTNEEHGASILGKLQAHGPAGLVRRGSIGIEQRGFF